ncbi:NAD(P)-dependent dehydrogenase (short-subunit alcohol dehydrogenase family) [Spinactinospora alkalitolerans]|uniref:NAD(P)-dependent dehydrogenase (Short-subunit alcohol dehydrogenase family) n=1 Tax=Spinactinospora alkalitolerans TaxID=687207 RepID=A0A852TYH1_9ACTN|nr:MFS transporter [Spinactinospora alkalitolerans]NYE47044.1 NAD(P)-dependent dehydrogenase (short-subunit alcohol dehydrogenase family) [Spinactinospora alkalitolerans]
MTSEPDPTGPGRVLHRPMTAVYPELPGRTAVITGAARGMGARFAAGLAARGVDVVGGDIDAEQMAATAEEVGAEARATALGDRPGRVLARRLDVTRPEEHEALARDALEEFGGIDFWINNAGIFPSAAAEEISAEQIGATLSVNVEGVLFGAQAAARHMRPGGAIVNMSSVSAWDAARVLEEADAGRTLRAVTLERLAEAMGVPADALIATVDRWNAQVPEGADPDFLRHRTLANKGSQHHPDPIDKAPFYAVRILPAELVCTHAGLEINADAAVLDDRGAVVPGLFAAGEAGAGVLGLRYVGGGNAAAHVAEPETFLGQLRVLKDGRVLYLAVANLFAACGLYGFTFFLPQIVQQMDPSYSATNIGFLGAIPFLVGAVGMLLVARNSDRTGERRFHVIALMLLAAAGLFGTIQFRTDPVIALACLSMVGIGVLGYMAPYWALASRLLSREHTAVGLAAINSIAALGGFFGPYVIGVNATADDVSVGLYFPIGCLVVCAVMLAFLKVPRADRPAAEAGAQAPTAPAAK